jgi:Abortive infection C-terminus
VPAPTLSKKPLLAFIAYCADVTLGEIDALFTGNGLTHLNEDFEPHEWAGTGGERRHRAAEYLSAIDMTDEMQQTRLLHVFDDLFAKDAHGEWQEKERKEIKRLLKRDGVRFEDGEIASDQLQLPDQAKGRFESALPDFSSITDVEVLREHAERMQRASLNADAPDAILAARELLESVCKLICEHYSVPVPKNPNAGQLYKLAAKAIGLDAGDMPDNDPAAAASRKVLSGLVRVVDGLGDLRTRIGRGHGRTEPSPARQRHADLAVGASGSLALFLLDTWQDRIEKEHAVPTAKE